jgi:hypothetical protein
MITPDTAWVVGSVVAAAIATGPAYLANRRNRRNSSEQTNAVTDVLATEFGRLHGRLDAQDAQLKEVRDWQAEHTTEHAVERLTTRGRLELRRRDPQ